MECEPVLRPWKRERMPVSLQKSGRLPRLRRRDIDFDFEGLVGAAIADVILRKRTKKRKGNWNASPKRLNLLSKREHDRNVQSLLRLRVTHEIRSGDFPDRLCDSCR